MFQFRRFPTYTYLIQCTLHGYCPCGLPHSEISGSQDICSSPKLIAACHVLRRLLMPRHSPCALSSLTTSSQSPLCSVSAFQRKLRPLPCSSFSSQSRSRWALLGVGTGVPAFVRLDQRNFGSLENYAGSQILEIVIVTLIFSDVVPQLKFAFPMLFSMETSLLPYFTCFHHIVQFSRCSLVGRNFTSLASAFAKARAVPFFLLFNLNPLRWASN